MNLELRFAHMFNNKTFIHVFHSFMYLVPNSSKYAILVLFTILGHNNFMPV